MDARFAAHRCTFVLASAASAHLSFVDILQTLWRRRLVFLVTFIVAEAAVIGVTFALPKTYTATATLYVGSAQVNRQLAFDSNLGQQLARTYVTLAGNPNVADDVVSQLAQQNVHKTRTDLLN